MYKEIIKHERNPILLILAMVGAVFLAFGILDIVVQPDMVRDILLFLLLAYGIFFLARYYLCTYEYAIIGDDLIFHRVLHNRQQLILNISISDIIGLYPYGAKELEAYQSSKKYTLCISKRHKQQYVVVFTANGAPVRVVFEPTQKLVNVLHREIEERK